MPRSFRTTLLMAGVLVFTGAHADFVAYSLGERERSPLPSRLDNVDTKYLVNVEWGEYAGRRSRVGVLEVDNTSTTTSFTVSTAGGDVDYSSSSTGVPVNGIEAMVIDAMNRTNRFRLVERTVLDDVLGEQDLAASGRVAQPSGAATGNVLGAEYLIQVVVTDYEANTSSTDGGVAGGLLRNRVPLLGGVKVGSGTGRVGLNFRLIDAETSEIVFSKQIESIINESSFSIGGIGVVGDGALGGFFSSYSRTPIGQAVIAGINQGVFELIQQIGTAPATGSVVRADERQVYVNLGSDRVSAGDVLEISEPGEELIDPETGISLGSMDTFLGTVRVVQVQEQFSVAEPVSLSATPSRGAKVVSTVEPAPLEYASSFDRPR